MTCGAVNVGQRDAWKCASGRRGAVNVGQRDAWKCASGRRRSQVVSSILQLGAWVRTTLLFMDGGEVHSRSHKVKPDVSDNFNLKRNKSSNGSEKRLIFGAAKIPE